MRAKNQGWASRTQALVTAFWLVSLSGCMPTQWTRIFNETGHSIVLEVQMSAAAPRVERLPNKERASFREKVDEIVSIEYRYNDQMCRLSGEDARRIARPTKGGIWIGERAQDIFLKGC
jgi:hypothetical protein